MKLIELLVLIGLVGVSLAADYCARELCGGNSNHIGCGNSGEFQGTCTRDSTLVRMANDYKKAIVQRINELRNALADGKVQGNEPSPRMATMQWDDELAKLAAMSVQKCKPEYDACHNTVRFPQSGQTIAALWSNFPHTATEQAMMLGRIDSWWTKKYDSVLAIEDNNSVGCAASFFRDPSFNYYYVFQITCNYAKSTGKGRIYSSGASASQCTTGSNPDFKALCSVHEQY